MSIWIVVDIAITLCVVIGGFFAVGVLVALAGKSFELGLEFVCRMFER